jgi:hypothetical protein
MNVQAIGTLLTVNGGTVRALGLDVINSEADNVTGTDSLDALLN